MSESQRDAVEGKVTLSGIGIAVTPHGVSCVTPADVVDLTTAASDARADGRPEFADRLGALAARIATLLGPV